MQGDEQFEPAIEVALTSFSPTKRLSTPNELRAWFELERDWITGIRGQANQSSTKEALATNLFQQLVAVCQRRVDECIEHINRQSPQSNFLQLANAYLSALTARSAINSQSRVGIFLSELAATDPLMAIRVASCYCGLRFAPNQTDSMGPWMRAAAISVVVENGLENNAPAFETMLGEVGSRWEGHFQTLEVRQLQAVTAQSAALAQFNARAAEGDALVTDYRNKSSAALIDAQAALEAVKETYKTELALQAPTTYWRAKQVGHRLEAAGWAGSFGLAAYLGGLFVWRVWALTAEPILQKIQSGNAATPSSIGVFLPTAGAAFLVVWVLRILSRQLLANFTLSSDAGERVAMVKTFLSLMQRPDHVKEDDRILILSALFRPSLTSSDDAAPPNWFDLLMQRVKKE